MSMQMLSVPGNVSGTTVGGPNMLHESCGLSQTGPEQVYEVIAPQAGTMQLTLNSPQDLGISVRTTCADVLSELGCEDSSIGGSPEVLLVNVQANQSLAVVVDGYSSSNMGTFSLDVEMVPPETTCSNFEDDDMDSLADCEDPDCQATATCTAGSTQVGGACTAASECVANASDPLCLDEAGMNWPNGYCSEFCNLSNDDCSGSGLCFDPALPSGNGICLQGCTSNGDCSTGYSCQTITGASSTVCFPESCSNVTTIMAGNTAGDTSNGYASNKAPSCISGSSGAPELVYAYTPTASGNLTVTLTSDPSTTPDLGFEVLTTCDDPSSQVACEDSHTGSTPETGTFAVTANTTYYIIVDGYYGDEGAFTLDLQLN
jgi:hypothetical protein